MNEIKTQINKIEIKWKLLLALANFKWSSSKLYISKQMNGLWERKEQRETAFSHL